MQAPHNNEMVRVVPWVLYGHVLEDLMVGPHNVVRPGPHYPLLPPCYPLPPIPTPRPSSWEEISRQILQACRRHRRRDLLVLYPATLLPKVHVQVPRNNQLRHPRFLSHRRLHISDSRPVARHNVAYHDVPAPIPFRQLARDDVRAKVCTYFKSLIAL